MKKNAAIGDFSQTGAAKVFEEEYSTTAEEQFLNLFAYFGKLPSEISPEDCAFVDQNFLSAKGLIKLNLNKSEPFGMNLTGAELQRIPTSITQLTQLKILYLTR